MNHAPLRNGLRLLGRATAPTPACVSDADLLDRFARHRDQAAFELLVWRHADMVLGTCRRLLRDSHEAEDAAQACFLVLARRAGAVGRRGSVGGWLHRVAFRVALRAASRRARRDAGRRSLDDHVPDAGAPDPAAGAEWREVRRVLDEEVNRLPDRYRVAFVLCCLEGRANADAARELGCPVGTVECRLTRARARLRAALGRRGVAVSAAFVAALPVREAAALVPATFAGVAARAVVSAPAVVIPAEVATLADGMVRAMAVAKFKAVAAVVVAATVLGTGSSILWQQPAAADPPASTPATPPAKAPATAADRLAALVQKLGSPTFAERERAAKELEAMGAPALDALRTAARGDDPERKKRAEELVKRIEARAALTKVLTARRVRLTYRDTPLAEAVADFKSKSGYDIILVDPTGALKDRKVTLDTGEVTFWQAVDRFCEAAGLTQTRLTAPGVPGAGFGGGGGAGIVRGGGMPGAGGAVVGGRPPDPFAASGRVVLGDGKWARRPTDDRTAVRVRAVNKSDAPAADGEILLHLEVTPEPRLRWQRTVGVDAKAATDDRGRALEHVRDADPVPAPPAGFGPGRGGGGVGVPFDPAAVRLVPVRLKKGDRSPAALKELSGTVAVQVLLDPEEYVAVDKVMDAAGRTVNAADGGGVRVIAATTEAGGKVRVKFAIDPPPAGGLAGGLFHMTLRGGRVVLTGGPGSAGEIEVALVDAKGAALTFQSAGVEVAGAGVQYTLVCQPGPDRAPARLVCAVCRSATLDVPFTLRDVPVP